MQVRFRKSAASSAGISLVEVLIAIGIVGLLLSLLAPALQMARESSRRSQCTSNLRQIAIGLQQYHDAHLQFPPTAFWAPPGEPLGKGLAPPGSIDRVSAGVASEQAPDRMFASWTVLILPFIEQQSLYEMHDRKSPIAVPQNERFRATDIALLKCPTDFANGLENHFQRGGMQHPDLGYARTNYAMNAGPNELCLARLGPKGKLNTCPDGFQVDGTDLQTNTRQVWGSGLGGLNRSFRISAITSGTSKMIAVEEIRAGINPFDRRGVWALGYPGSSVTAAHGIKGNGGPNAKRDNIQGCSAAVGPAGDANLQGMPCATRSDPMREVSEKATSRSLHAAGVNVAMADGSVHFIEDGIDSKVWEQAHKRNNSVPLEYEFD